MIEFNPNGSIKVPGTTALDFAYRQHLDFRDNFIRAIDIKTRKT